MKIVRGYIRQHANAGREVRKRPIGADTAQSSNIDQWLRRTVDGAGRNQLQWPVVGIERANRRDTAGESPEPGRYRVGHATDLSLGRGNSSQRRKRAGAADLEGAKDVGRILKRAACYCPAG